MTIFANTVYLIYILSFTAVLAKMILTLVGPFSQALQEAESISRRISWAIMADKFKNNPMGLLAAMIIPFVGGVLLTYLAYWLFKNHLSNEFFGWWSFDRKPVWIAVFCGGIAMLYIQTLSNYIRGYFEFKKDPLNVMI